ncbi:MAG: L-ribulose-5-phosphate 4-epimerase [Actinomycetaceae bacterium]|nr:L-ribulose-5-phosphate 4-epimerase [Actinomycetaceae bacterium]
MLIKRVPQEVNDEINELRPYLAKLHLELIRWGLVVWTAGNISQRLTTDPSIFIIKPSGVSYDELDARSMVVCDLEANKLNTDNKYVPSSDTAAHAYVYKNMDHIGGVVHTHSTYATSWAASREPISCELTMMADEFGGEIPVGPFALIGDDSIGRGIVETLKKSRSRAVLMANHGPFTVGKDAKDALKAAVMCEEVAKTIHTAHIRSANRFPIPQDKVDRLWERYQNVYGQ